MLGRGDQPQNIHVLNLTSFPGCLYLIYAVSTSCWGIYVLSYVTPLQEDPQRPAPNLPWISPHAPFPFADSTGLYPFTGINHGI